MIQGSGWMFDGIDPEKPIGDFGTVFGGAAGSEIDSADSEMGTPPHALVVAQADDFGVDFHWVNEEFYHTGSAVNGETCPLRFDANMVFYETIMEAQFLRRLHCFCRFSCPQRL